jgi:hypothetical protein
MYFDWANSLMKWFGTLCVPNVALRQAQEQVIQPEYCAPDFLAGGLLAYTNATPSLASNRWH